MEVTYFKSIHKSQEPDERPALKSLYPRAETLGEWDHPHSRSPFRWPIHSLATRTPDIPQDNSRAYLKENIIWKVFISTF